MDPALNPYTNPNLDADLSSTIGKMRGTRKKINANQFLLPKEDAQADEETTTQDRTRSGATGSGGSNNRRSMSQK